MAELCSLYLYYICGDDETSKSNFQRRFRTFYEFEDEDLKTHKFKVQSNEVYFRRFQYKFYFNINSVSVKRNKGERKQEDERKTKRRKN